MRYTIDIIANDYHTDIIVRDPDGQEITHMGGQLDRIVYDAATDLYEDATKRDGRIAA